MDALICNHCGARLDVAPTTKFVTCARCDSVLAIKDTGSARFTEALGPAAAPATDVTETPAPPARKGKASRKFMGADDVALEEELNAIDRAWQVERERYLMSSEFGRQQVPDKRRGLLAGAVLIGLAFVLFLIFRALTPTTATEVGPFVSGFVLLFGIGLGWFQYSKAVDYERAFDAYQARRTAVIAKYRQ